MCLLTGYGRHLGQPSRGVPAPGAHCYHHLPRWNPLPIHLDSCTDRPDSEACTTRRAVEDSSTKHDKSNGGEQNDLRQVPPAAAAAAVMSNWMVHAHSARNSNPCWCVHAGLRAHLLQEFSFQASVTLPQKEGMSWL